MNLDVRVKLLIAALFTTAALYYQNPFVLGTLLLLNLATLKLFKISFKGRGSIGRFYGYYLFFVFLYSFFVKEGTVILSLGSVTLLTTGGLLYGAVLLLRFSLLTAAALFLLSCPAAELAIALVKMRVPYEIVFMVMLGIRFLPLLGNELNYTLNMARLRGLNIKAAASTGLLKLISGLLFPLAYGALEKAENIEVLLKLRAFRLYPQRTYYRDLALSKQDYLAGFIVLLGAVLFALSVKFFLPL
ncbi:MAG TPA: energy-coupling factor transporter transmembrane protein EcfT [Firmicutes bacterium]|nr:energy-coupling factor transporter transmembrane protein EcfT [Bacillota bacterium]